MKMRSVFAKAPFQFDVREIDVPRMGVHDVLVRVKACGLCGTDVRTAALAEEFEPIGHEVAGVVEAVGAAVENVKPGDSVCLESGTFDRFSDLSRNGRVDLDKTGRSMFNSGVGTMGFAEKMVVPSACCVKFDGLSFAEAALIEPLGVAYDLLKVAGVELGDDVLVYGIGPIGLFALRLARLLGARRIYAVNRSGRDARDKLALKWGANEVLHTDKCDLSEYPFARGGVDRILMTATPDAMPAAMKLMNVGGIMGFIGIGVNETRFVTFDMRHFHDEKLQIRASNAVPALFFPACLELLKSGMVDMKAMISHKIRLDRFAEDVAAYNSDRAGALKAVMEL
ncbi:MAG: alcohol dehydrogenase catalytic domain-containing protein [Clostridiales bacterium]|nr:alcohol dehydrogenase catalytic domain-containing protein [Clostridiales bacterium]